MGKKDEKALKFIKLLAPKLSQVISEKEKLQDAYDDVITRLPEGSLRTTLKANHKRFYRELENLVSKEASCSQATKGKATGEFGYNLFLKKGHKLNKAKSANRSQEEETLLSHILLAQRFDKLKKSKPFFKLVRNEKEGAKEEEEDDSWLEDVRRMCILTCGEKKTASLRNLMNLYKEKLIASADTVLSNKDTKRAKELQKEVLSFLVLVNFRHGQMDEDFSSFSDLMAALLSVYVDLSIVITRTAENKSKSAKKVISKVMYMLRDQPEYVLDVLLQLSSVTAEDEEIVLPLARKVLRKPSDHPSKELYSKQMVAVKHILQSFPDALDIKKVALETAAPTDYLDWLRDQQPDIMDNIPETKKFAGLHISKFFIEEADMDLLYSILDLLTAEGSMDETTEAEPEEAEEGIASGAEKDVNSAAVEEKEEEPKQGGEMLFYIDVGANEKTKKTMQLQFDSTKEEDGEEILDGISSTNLDKEREEGYIELSSSDDEGEDEEEEETAEEGEEEDEIVAKTIQTVNALVQSEGGKRKGSQIVLQEESEVIKDNEDEDVESEDPEEEEIEEREDKEEEENEEEEELDGEMDDEEGSDKEEDVNDDEEECVVLKLDASPDKKDSDTEPKEPDDELNIVNDTEQDADSKVPSSSDASKEQSDLGMKPDETVEKTDSSATPAKTNKMRSPLSLRKKKKENPTPAAEDLEVEASKDTVKNPATPEKTNSMSSPRSLRKGKKENLTPVAKDVKGQASEDTEKNTASPKITNSIISPLSLRKKKTSPPSDLEGSDAVAVLSVGSPVKGTEGKGKESPKSAQKRSLDVVRVEKGESPVATPTKVKKTQDVSTPVSTKGKGKGLSIDIESPVLTRSGRKMRRPGTPLLQQSTIISFLKQRGQADDSTPGGRPKSRLRKSLAGITEEKDQDVIEIDSEDKAVDPSKDHDDVVVVEVSPLRKREKTVASVIEDEVPTKVTRRTRTNSQSSVLSDVSDTESISTRTRRRSAAPIMVSKKTSTLQPISSESATETEDITVAPRSRRRRSEIPTSSIAPIPESPVASHFGKNSQTLQLPEFIGRTRTFSGSSMMSDVSDTDSIASRTRRRSAAPIMTAAHANESQEVFGRTYSRVGGARRKSMRVTELVEEEGGEKSEDVTSDGEVPFTALKDPIKGTPKKGTPKKSTPRKTPARLGSAKKRGSTPSTLAKGYSLR